MVGHGRHNVTAKYGLEGDSLQVTKADEDEDKAIVIEDDFSFPLPDIQGQI